MGKESFKKQKSVTRPNYNERTGNRWLLVFYDSLLYVLCWLGVFVAHPFMDVALTVQAEYLFLIAGYVLFFAFRFGLRCYKQIWRYGATRTYSRELLAGLLAAFALVLLGVVLDSVFHVAQVPSMLLIFFCAVYIVISMTVRISYFYLHYIAQQNTALSRMMRFLLERFAFVSFTSDQPGATLSLGLRSERHSDSPINDLKNIAEKFLIHGDITSIKQINKGYINRTYKVETLSAAGHVHKYILQRINTNVFPDVDALMENFKLTTDHLRDRLHLPGHREKHGSVQTIRLTKDGKSFLRDDSGYWRLMTYFDNVYSLDLPDSPETFYHAGNAFGKFMKEMSDIDPKDVKEVIPNFHNTMSRYKDLEEAISRDPKNRVKDVAPEIDFVRARADRYGIISDALDSGKIPTRVCHNDCNLNNILFDAKTHLPVAIIDLDTVMPSSPLYDFGDSMRIGTNTAKDDEKDLSKVSCDLNLYEQYARGYLAACGDVLTGQELELLPYASLIITAEDGIRFLMDYINGDVYYHIYYPEQNLDRARTQLKLVEDMERKLPEIKKILQNIYAELGLLTQIG